MRVFLDTTVVVAALATRGLAADVVRTVLAEHEALIGEVVLEELREVLVRTLRAPSEVVESTVAFLSRFEIVPRPERLPPVEVRDADDAWVLASALAARAGVLITGDDDLLVLREVAGMPIVSPRGFWEMLKR